MERRLVRRLALLLIAAYAFGQAGIALAACGMDRGAMAEAMLMPDGSTCDGCPTQESGAVGAVCAAHCLADLQVPSSRVDAFQPPSLFVALVPVPPARLEVPPIIVHLPSGGPPRRILLHSFQV